MNKMVYKELFKNINEPKTLKQYEEKLTTLNEFLNYLITIPKYFKLIQFDKELFKMFQQVQILTHSWEKINHEFRKIEKSEQETILEVKNEIGIKCFLIYQTKLSTITPQEKLAVVRNVYPLIRYNSSFSKCLRFEELYLLDKIHGKMPRDNM